MRLAAVPPRSSDRAFACPSELGKKESMPELPDVEVYRRYLDATSLHQKIRSATVIDSRMLKGISSRELQARTKGRFLDSTRRHGKYLFAPLDRGSGWLVFHFGMTGDLKYAKGGVHDRHARVILDFMNGYRLLYRDKRRFGEVRFAGDADSFIRGKGLGPDAIDIGRGAFDRLLARSRGSIKPLLMNQKAIAGIGNIYSDEMLFQSNIHPASRAKGLGEEQTARLYRSMLFVLKTAVRKHADSKRFPASYLIHQRDEGGALSPVRIQNRENEDRRPQRLFLPALPEKVFLKN
jgi:formamidopyrimidine-DNA glycosylase